MPNMDFPLFRGYVSFLRGNSFFYVVREIFVVLVFYYLNALSLLDSFVRFLVIPNGFVNTKSVRFRLSARSFCRTRTYILLELETLYVSISEN